MLIFYCPSWLLSFLCWWLAYLDLLLRLPLALDLCCWVPRGCTDPPLLLSLCGIDWKAMEPWNDPWAAIGSPPAASLESRSSPDLTESLKALSLARSWDWSGKLYWVLKLLFLDSVDLTRFSCISPELLESTRWVMLATFTYDLFNFPTDFSSSTIWAPSGVAFICTCDLWFWSASTSCVCWPKWS